METSFPAQKTYVLFSQTDSKLYEQNLIESQKFMVSLEKGRRRRTTKKTANIRLAACVGYGCLADQADTPFACDEDVM